VAEPSGSSVVASVSDVSKNTTSLGFDIGITGEV
jgi:hypothetical protein